MQYVVRALSADHIVTELTVDAFDEVDARRQTEARGLYAASIAPARHALFGRITSKASSRSMSLVLFSQELLALLTAGLSIVESLEALLEKETNDATHQVLSRLLLGLREGKRFSRVLAEQPDLFPPLYIGIVQAAEGTSDLPQSLARFIDYQQRIDSVRSKIISAMIYPMILLLVGGGVTFFLIGYVVPRFADVYRGAGRSLPLLSELLLEWGRFAGSHAHLLFPGLSIASLLLLVWLRIFVTQGGLAQALVKLPGIGERVRIYELSRLYLTLGMLLEGGIPIVAALNTVQGIVSAQVKSGLQVATETIQSGTPLSVAFVQNRLTTPISLRMLRVGERSGELGQMLTQSATFYDGEISRWIDRFTRTFEPLLMAAIGLVVGAIVVLLYMPIFDLAGSLS
ncbi:type II secretion system F family protein [Noviherbaspirillum cavernae]|uniref:Type II secretion system F family protein n=1 Tax=Noviherbaspirillum cavernae TaxID=2320862 RepID=A0A418WYW2_9BURK|nr:type II secretion system F family protein [Noviherbaspirillum cavernae]RJG05283.1 type II secretion system F family protein [Noviherbaspirillum cavernae]